jgi:23S rRNA (guanine745-N1)-methyltransferase
MPGRPGVALDASRFAARRAARAHPRAGAVVCDIWRALPVRSGVARVLLGVFAPRNGAEAARVLSPGGTLVVVTPTGRHLSELADPLAMLAVDARKEERLEAALAPHVTEVDRNVVEAELELDHPSLRRLVRMGPSGHHVDADELDERVGAMAERVRATASVTLSCWRRAG